MKNLPERQIVKRKRERGIALLFTLGILGLLTVLALSFAASSMMERKAAQYNAGASSARILAQAGLSRAIAAMGFYMTYSDDYDVIVSKAPSGTPAYDFIYRLNTNTDGTCFVVAPSDYNPTSSISPHWVYADNGGTTSGASPTYQLIGRFAYAVIAAGGRLDPSTCVDTGIQEQTMDASGLTAGEPRIGVYVREIPVPGLEPNMNNWLSSTNVNKMNYSGTGGGQLSTGRWIDYSTFFTDVGLSSTGTDLVKRTKWYWDWFIVDESQEINQAYWIDLNNDGKRSSTEYFPRFDLANAAWDTGLGTSANSSAAVDALRGASVTRSPFSDDSASYIEWLRQSDISGYSDNLPITGTGFSSSANRAKQIAANIIDYCDTDSIPTSDIATPAGADYSTWASAEPTYTGNEKTPYINELGVKVTAYINVSNLFDPDATPASGDEYYEYTPKLLIDVVGELVNIYSTASPQVRLTVKGTYSCTATFNGANVFAPKTDEPFTVTKVYSSFGTNNYESNWTNATTTSVYEPAMFTQPQATGVSVFTVNDFAIKIDSAYLEYLDTTLGSVYVNADYVKLSKGYKSTGNILLTNAPGAAGTTATNYYFLSYEVDDPRQNLNSGDWPDSNFKEKLTSNATEYTGTIGSLPENECMSLASGADTESSLLALSTAYIRNAPMLSPWELGVIHRGAPWETINLKKYNTTGGAYLTMGTYANGDANILDQIKMTSDVKTYGLVNLKTSNQEVLQALFTGIPVNSDYAGLNSSTSNPVTPSYAASIAANVKTYMSSNSIKNRGQIVNAVGVTDASVMTVQTNDAAKEAIIGKMINLTMVDKANIFKILVISQTLKDAGGPYGTNVKLYKDFNANGSSSDSISSGDNAALMKLGFRDPSSLTNYSTLPTLNESRDCQKGVYDIGFDEITGEQKIIATVKYDTATGKWIILNYELVSE